ncbi:methyltransferase [Amycolatopsis sp. cmx-4-68]|uniref:methyltransferase n=1 Tax=Amycolatopsis sp. cmx-4-68 TaxID=2790938 RepID=UPI00397BA130
MTTDARRQVTVAVETAATVDAARRLGVLRRLAASPRTPAELAADLSLDPSATGRILDTLGRLGLLQRDQRGSFGADPATVRCFETITEAWGELSEVVRTGTPPTRADTVAGAMMLYPVMVTCLSGWFAPAAARLGELLSPPPARILDVGVGAAPWSIAVAARGEHTHVTALDLPPVLEVTRQAVAEAGLTARFSYLPGDIFTTELPADSYDLALIGNVCHLFDPARNRTLLANLRRSIRPGGRIAIVDVLPATDPAEQLTISRYELGLLLRTSAGRVHPFAAYRAWATEAGFHGLAPFALSSDPPLSLLLSRSTGTAGSSSSIPRSA